MGWQTVGGSRTFVEDHFLAPIPSSRNVLLKSEEVDEFISRLKVATPQEIRDYVNTHTADAQEVRLLLARLAVAVAYVLASSSGS